VGFFSSLSVFPISVIELQRLPNGWRPSVRYACITVAKESVDPDEADVRFAAINCLDPRSVSV
jgi:hypothetical protein